MSLSINQPASIENQDKKQAGMGKTLVTAALLASLSSLSVNAQQYFKSKTDINGMSVVTLSTVADGTNPDNVVGKKGFSSYDNSGYVAFVNPNTTEILSPTKSTYDVVASGEEIISNGKFSTLFGDSEIDEDFLADDKSGNLSIVTLSEFTNTNELNDGVKNLDGVFARYYIPHTLEDGSPVATGTRAIMKGRNGTFNDATRNVFGQIAVYRFDGTTRVAMSTDRKGRTTAVIPDISDGSLDAEEFTQEVVAKPMLIQDPSTDSFIYDDGDADHAEDVIYQLVDVGTGRVIQSGLAKENQPIQHQNQNTHGAELFLERDKNGSIKAVVKTLHQ